MAQHTQGPWTYNHEYGCIEDNKNILAFLSRAAGGDAETEARGRLMAAAPDLLQALKQILALASYRDIDDDGPTVVVAIPRDDYDALQALIANAEGLS